MRRTGPTRRGCMAASLALLGPLMGAVTQGFATPDTRFAATMTLVVTGSGLAAYGIGAAFWGLLAGLAVHGMAREKMSI